MVDDLRLTEVLQRAGDEIELPDDAFERVLAAAGETQGGAAEGSPARRSRARLLLTAAAAVAVISAGVVVAQGGITGERSKLDAIVTDNGGVSVDGSGLVDGSPDGGSGAGTGGSDDGFSPGLAPGVPGAPMPSPAARVPNSAGAPLRDTARIVRTGTSSLEVDEGKFAATMAALTRLANAVNGYVAASATSENDDRPSGSVTLRIPGESFDRVVADVRGLGDVIALTVNATDVTAEFTDLEARLKALKATRSQFVTLLSKATKIGEILEVQTRINDIQVQIEQTEGKLRLLDSQTSYGSLKVEVYESGDVLVQRIDEPSRFGRAWDDSVDGFLSGVAALVSAAGPILLIVLCLLAFAVLGRIAYRLTRRRLV
jgi:hypothetical protein